MNKKLILALAAIGGVLFIAIVGVVIFVFMLASQNNLIGTWKSDKESSEFTKDTVLEFTKDTVKLNTTFVVAAQNINIPVVVEMNYTIEKKENDSYFLKTSNLKVSATTEDAEMKDLLEKSLKESFAKQADKLMQYNVSNGNKTLTEKGVEGAPDLTYTKK